MFTHIYVYVCLCMFMYVYVCICMYMYVYVCICMYMYVCVYIYMYAYILWVSLCGCAMCVHCSPPPNTTNGIPLKHKREGERERERGFQGRIVDKLRRNLKDQIHLKSQGPIQLYYEPLYGIYECMNLKPF